MGTRDLKQGFVARLDSACRKHYTEIQGARRSRPDPVYLRSLQMHDARGFLHASNSDEFCRDNLSNSTPSF